MSKLAYPPYRKPRIACEDPDPPAAHVDILGIPNVQLIVSKLPRNSITSAAHHLRAILEEHTLQHPSDPLVPFRIIPGDEFNPVDYVFVSVDPEVAQEPRPDLLEDLRVLLTSFHGLQADWKVRSGPDPTRMIYFDVDSFAEAEALHPKLRTHLNERGCPFQYSFVSNAMNRITFDLLDRASVGSLFKTPPVIDHQTLYPSVPRYIQPVHGLEVGILGVQDVWGVVPIIDNYIKSKYGDVIACSHLALNGDAYCVGFETWPQTLRFLLDPFTAFDGVTHQAPPALLYVLNSNGSLSSACDSSNTSLRQLRARFDLLRQMLDAWLRALEALISQVEHFSQLLLALTQQTAAHIAGLSTFMSASTHLQIVTSRLEALQSDARRSQLLLTITPPDRSNAIVQHLVQHLRSLDSEIPARRIEVAQAQNSLSAAEQLLPPLPFPYPSPLNPPTRL